MITATPRQLAQGRSCGTCTLCCKAVPVAAVLKPRDRWCPHCQKGKGCAIYDTRPEECRHWSCLYLLDAQLPEALKPNRSHVVFDTILAPVAIDGKERHALQVWIDAGYPDSWRQPDVLRQMKRYMRDNGVLILVRLGYDAVLIGRDPHGVIWERFLRVDPPAVWDDSETWQVEDYWRRQGKTVPT